MESRIPIGEELEIDMLPKDKSTCDIIQIPLVTEKGKPQYSEFKAWIEFILGGKDRLEKYVEKIIAALRALKEHAQHLGLNRINSIKIEKLLNEGLGGLYGEINEHILKDLLITTAKLHNYDVEEKESGIFIKGTHITGVKTLLDYYKALESLLKDVEIRLPVILMVGKSSITSNLRELYLYEVIVNVNNRPAHSEVIGVAINEDNSIEICTGAKLLRLLNKLLINTISIGDQLWYEEKFGDKVGTKVLSIYRNVIIDEYVRYLTEMEKGFSTPHNEWIPREYNGKDASYFLSASPRFLGVIIVVGDGNKTSPPPITVEEIEKKAMEYAMEFERKNHRIPEDVSKIEHYDIKSIDPNTGEIRFIEVKGKWYSDITIELTETEYEYAKKHSSNYWLYIVYGFSTSSPKLLAIRDPVNRAKWDIREVKKYRFLGV
jgi:hypothetical protein